MSAASPDMLDRFRASRDKLGYGIVDLAIRPERFFRELLQTNPYHLPFFLVWVVGITAAVERFDTRLAVLQTFGNALPEQAVQWMTLWPGFLVAGLIGGALAWLIWGWWFRTRLRFCGVVDPDKREARLVWIYSRSVYTVPSIGWLIAVTAIHDDYQAAWNAAPWNLTLVGLYFWSVWVGYRGATSWFPVKKAPALWWFLILPLALYGTVLGAVIVLTFVGMWL